LFHADDQVTALMQPCEQSRRLVHLQFERLFRVQINRVEAFQRDGRVGKLLDRQARDQRLHRRTVVVVLEFRQPG